MSRLSVDFLLRAAAPLFPACSILYFEKVLRRDGCYGWRRKMFWTVVVVKLLPYRVRVPSAFSVRAIE